MLYLNLLFATLIVTKNELNLLMLIGKELTAYHSTVQYFISQQRKDFCPRGPVSLIR